MRDLAQESIAWGAWAARTVAYVALVAGAALAPWLDLGNYVDGQLFTEHTILEAMEIVAIALSMTMVLLAAVLIPESRSLSLVLGLLLLGALIRELDLFLDRYVFDGAWQMLVTLVLAAIASTIWRDRRAFRRALRSMSTTPAIGFLAVGALTTAVFSRLFGKQEFWQEIMQESYNRSVKNAVEETVEFYGYTLILIGIIEYILWLKRARSP